MTIAVKPGAAQDARLSPAKDFQEHLARLEAQGLVVRVERPINKDTELHPLARWQFQGAVPEDKRRAFLFTNVTGGDGRKFDMPVAVCAFAASPEMYALGLGVKIEDIGRAWLKAIQNPIPPVRVNSAACQEVVIKGDDLKKPGGGLAALPVPISTPGFDAAPYLCATICITKDPESGIRNMGTYRGQLKATDRLGVRMASRLSGAGGYAHWLKYQKLKKPMPIAIVIGCAPAIFFTGPQKLAIDQDEMGVAGALLGEGVKTVRCITNDLEVPADSEIVIEGVIDENLLEPEGPFGESHGHVALEDYNMSMQVTAITMKKKPVFVSIVSQVTPSESSVTKKVAYEPLFLAHLKDHLGVKGISRVVMHEALTNVRPVIFLNFAPGTPKTEIWRGLHGAATLQAQCGKIVIAVGEDIDASNADAVFWSLAYRTNLNDDLQISPNRAAGHGPKSGTRSNDATLLIDATPKHPMPPFALPAREFMEKAKTIWEELGLPQLNPQPPWYGYNLGDWDANWDRWAQLAIEGKWEEMGLETFAGRKAGIIPETPVRSAGGKTKKEH
jgi:UbiD family decarboxylase